jgi:hypothetical protein
MIAKNLNQPITVGIDEQEIGVGLGVYTAESVTGPTTWYLPEIGTPGTLLGEALFILNNSAFIISLEAAAGQTIAGAGSYNVATGASVIVFVRSLTEWIVYSDSSISSAGSITGPGSSTVNAVVRWGDMTGTSLLDSAMLVDNNGGITGIGDVTQATTGVATNTFNLSTASGRLNLVKTGTANTIRQYHCMSSMTTSAITATTVQTFNMPATSCVGFVSNVTIRTATNCAFFTITAAFKNIGGVVTQISSPQTTQVSDVLAWAAALSVSGTDVLLTTTTTGTVVVDATTVCNVNV